MLKLALAAPRVKVTVPLLPSAKVKVLPLCWVWVNVTNVALPAMYCTVGLA